MSRPGIAYRSSRWKRKEGAGLRLVQEYADSWGGWLLGDGLLDRGAGKLLWFEVGGCHAAARRVVPRTS